MQTDNIQTQSLKLNCDKWSNRGFKKQAGFTLIEIAIVLVIIGLLLGGVLKGQELINTARVRSLSNNVDGITSAWFSFSDRYRAFPGDYAQAAVNLPNINNNGDGNGWIDGDDERALVWSHLQAAGYITGSFPDGAAAVSGGAASTVPTVSAGAYDCAIAICPDNGYGQGMLIDRGALQQSGGALAHELLTGRQIPSDVLAELDRKIDDGTASAGSMQLGRAGTGATGWGSGTEIPACQSTDDATTYNMKTPSDNCAAVFRNF